MVILPLPAALQPTHITAEQPCLTQPPEREQGQTLPQTAPMRSGVEAVAQAAAMGVLSPVFAGAALYMAAAVEALVAALDTPDARPQGVPEVHPGRIPLGAEEPQGRLARGLRPLAARGL